MTLRYALTAFVSLCALDAAHAETVVSSSTTTNLRTSTAASGARDDIRIAAEGAVRPTGGVAVTLDSNNTVTSAGAIGVQNADGAVGILIEGGRTGSVTNTGSITIDETATPADADNDGDPDGRFATGSGRFGIRLTGAAPFVGSITHSSGVILVEGNGSAGISLESALTGNLSSTGTVNMLGDDSFAVRVQGPVSGGVTLGGTMGAVGARSLAAAVDGDVGGALLVSGALTATGYRFTTAPTTPAALSALDADDLLQGGSALRVTGDVARGVLIDAPPPNLDPNDADEDKDGTADANEPTGALTVFGSAPALQIGGAEALSIGAVASDAEGFGLVIKGRATAAGVYSGASATAVSLGGAGGAVAVAGGARVDGILTSTALGANATGLRMGAGAGAPVLAVSGQINATATGETALAVRGVAVDAGGSLATLRNSGSIIARIVGEAADVRAVSDLSGALTRVENSGVISASLNPTDGPDAGESAADEVVTGRAVALDLAANTSGVVVRQFGRTDGDDGRDNVADPDADADGVDDNDEPGMLGDILFGSGADQLLVENGLLAGAISFGAGADLLRLTGGAGVSGALTDSDGRLTVDVQSGRLRIENAAAINLTALTVGSGGTLVFTADPVARTATRLNVSGAANLSTGAKLGLRFSSKLTDAQTFRLISAGSLSTGVANIELENAPFLYVGTLSVSQAAGAVDVSVRRRTAAEIGMNAAQSAAFDAVYANFDRDPAISQALLGKTDAPSFLALYDQFLPDYGGGIFAGLETAQRVTSRAVSEHGWSDAIGGAWVTQAAFGVEQEPAGGLGFENTGFVIAGGFETEVADLGTFGLSASFVSGKLEDSAAALLEEASMTSLGAGLYWRKRVGDFQAHAAAGAARVTVDSTRTLQDTSLTLANDVAADWSGYSLTGDAGLAWRGRFGPLRVTPQVGVNYFRLAEDGYSETSRVRGVALTVDERVSDLFTADAKLAVGLEFGRSFRWGPEATVGWRQVLSGNPGETRARFADGGDAFTLVATPYDGGGPIARVGFTAGDESFWRVKVDVGAQEIAERRSYDAHASVHVRF